MSVYPFIAAEKGAAQATRKACTLLSVSRSAYYQWSKQVPSAHAQEDARLAERITTIHHESRETYGSPRVHRQLRREGIRCGRKRVARLMSRRGLAGRSKRRFKTTTIADPAAGTVAKDHLRRTFTPASVELDQAWVGDITYLRTWEGWCYLATVIDLASRRVVGFATAGHMKTSLVTEAFTMALVARRPAPGLIFHSDRGSQYTSAAFRELLGGNGVVQSLSRPRQCWDNAVAESTSPPSRPNSSIVTLGRHVLPPGWPCSSSLRSSTTAAVCTRRWGTLPRRSMRPRGFANPPPPQRLKKCVRQIGASPPSLPWHLAP